MLVTAFVIEVPLKQEEEMSLMRNAMLVSVSMLAGAGVMYFYTKGRVMQASQLVVQYHQLEKKNRELEGKNATLELQCSATEHHKQQEGLYFAEALKKTVEIRNLKRRMLSIASRNNDAQALQEILIQDPALATEAASPMFNENWLHLVARSQHPGVNRIAKVFIDYGVDREARNADGQRPIDIARMSGTWEVIEVLQSYKSQKTIRAASN